MRLRNVCWLIGALAVAAVTIALAALIVVLMPIDPTVAAIMQHQAFVPKVEAIVESHGRTR
jgi:hypothetical protein